MTDAPLTRFHVSILAACVGFFIGAAVALGVANEVARLNNPVSQYSRMWASANLHNWFHFLGLRMDSHAQWEMRMFANAVGKIVQTLWPRCYDLFEEHSLCGKHLSRSEWSAIETVMKKEVSHGLRISPEAAALIGNAKK